MPSASSPPMSGTSIMWCRRSLLVMESQMGTFSKYTYIYTYMYMYIYICIYRYICI